MSHMTCEGLMMQSNECYLKVTRLTRAGESGVRAGEGEGPESELPVRVEWNQRRRREKVPILRS